MIRIFTGKCVISTFTHGKTYQIAQGGFGIVRVQDNNGHYKFLTIKSFQESPVYTIWDSYFGEKNTPQTLTEIYKQFKKNFFHVGIIKENNVPVLMYDASEKDAGLIKMVDLNNGTEYKIKV